MSGLLGHSATSTCPACGAAMPSGTFVCETCSSNATSAPPSSVSGGSGERGIDGADAVTRTVDTGYPSLVTDWRRFGPRYDIRRLLGVGGMGAVYQAWDNELGVDVALKVIRPDIAKLSSEPERLFKRELLLARQVTHKNVIRIHDLGEVGGTKYISMPFIEGEDLATTLRRRGPLAMAEALRIARQIASGLTAAHEAGVVHRDLKPANVLLSGDLAVITDFGVAYSLTGASETIGGVVGTWRYMAPEQARGLPVDHRADVYAFGLILYEMLAGSRWDGGETIAVQPGRDGPSLRDFSPRAGWPTGVNQILTRCLTVDPLKRYGSAAMLLDDLGTLDEGGSIVARPSYLHVPSSWPLIGGQMIARGTAAALLALTIVVPIVGGGAYLTSARLTRNALRQPEIKSVLIADFDNRTGDPVFNQIGESALSIALEGASFVDVYPRRDALRLSEQVSRERRLDVPNARVVAQREGIDIIVAASMTANASRFTINVDAIDPVPGTVLATRSVTAASRDEVLAAIGHVGAALRAALGDTTPQSVEASRRETFTAASVEAAGAYSQAQELLNASRYAESVPLFERAIELDPQFGRAYASWAVSSYYLGRRDQAEELYKKAFSLTDRMSERERLRTYGTYYLTVAQAYQEAVTTYTKLVERYPGDRAAHGNLAVAHFYTLNFAKALESGRRALNLYPTSLKYRNNVALYAMYSNNFTLAAEGARRVLAADPSYFQAYVPLAVSAIVTGSEPAIPLYERMAKTGARGASRAAVGIADLALYEGREGDALSSLPPAIERDLQAGDRVGGAVKYIVLAEAELARGDHKRAANAATQALALSSSEAILLSAGRVYVATDHETSARQLVTKLTEKTQGYSRAYGEIILGDLALARRAPADAVDAFRAAQKAADLWLVHLFLGRAYVEAGRFPEAIAEFDTCVRRRGEATAVFLDDLPTVRYLTTLPYWHGRAQEGLGLSAAAAANYKQFLGRREAANDLLVRDARARVARLSATAHE
jgi:eukaryotic-like serine/threonine-protein kinase